MEVKYLEYTKALVEVEEILKYFDENLINKIFIEKYMSNDEIYSELTDEYIKAKKKSIGSMFLNNLISEPLLAEPKVGCTETFMSIGNFTEKYEAENLLKYIGKSPLTLNPNFVDKEVFAILLFLF